MTTYALIHGAGDVGWYWHLVEAELRARGHDTVAPDLPVEDDAAGLEAYAGVVVEGIGDRQDVAVVAQSFGGYVAPIVAARIGARLIVLVAGMIPWPGESAEEMFANTGWRPAPQKDQSTRAIFYHDVPTTWQTRLFAASAVNPTRPAANRGRSPLGLRYLPGSSSAGTTGSSRPIGSDASLVNGSRSRPTRSRAGTARR
jgi:pimeloyl-ACP methyl ester carboxylesterase